MKPLFHILYLIIIGCLLLAVIGGNKTDEPNQETTTPDKTSTDLSQAYQTYEENYYDRNLAFLGNLQSIPEKVKEDPALGVMIDRIQQAIRKQDWEIFSDSSLQHKFEAFYNQPYNIPKTIITCLGLDLSTEIDDAPPFKEIIDQLTDLWFVGWSPYSDTEVILFGYVKLASGLVIKSLVVVDQQSKPYDFGVFMG